MKIIENTVRGVAMHFVGYTRSLELCARMNYETENLDFIDQIPAGSVLYDLGACEGRFSIYAALKGIRCFAFEPEMNNYTAFGENIAANHITEDQLKTFKVAISDAPQKVKLRIGQPWAGGHQKVVEQADVRSDLAFNFVEEEIVDAESLDSAIERYQLPLPNYLKIDIDGSELAFIRGAGKTLTSSELKKIIFELEVTDKHYNIIVNELERSGFREESRHQVPNEPNLYNIIYAKR